MDTLFIIILKMLTLLTWLSYSRLKINAIRAFYNNEINKYGPCTNAFHLSRSLSIYHQPKITPQRKIRPEWKFSRKSPGSLRHDTPLINQTYSPTVNPISLFILSVKVATVPHYSISVYDVTCAFFNSAIPEEILSLELSLASETQRNDVYMTYRKILC